MIVIVSVLQGWGSPQLYYHDSLGQIPGHTTREPQVGFELETNCFQFYAIANLDKTSLVGNMTVLITSDLPPPSLVSSWIKMILHLLSIGNKHLWELAQLSPLKGGASRWTQCLLVPAPDNEPTTGNTCPPSLLLLLASGLLYNNIAVLTSMSDKDCLSDNWKTNFCPYLLTW